MSVLIFLIILSVLVFVHELGHFLFAKWNNIRIDSFAIGFPPTLWKKKKGETAYKLNAIPLGGYVSIYGENYDELDPADPDYNRSFVMKRPWQQLLVLIGGILFNFIFAFLVLVVVAWIQSPIVTETYDPRQEYDPAIELTALEVIQDSPAYDAGIRSGDVIVGISISDDGGVLTETELSIETFITTIQEAPRDVVIVVNDFEEYTITPQSGLGEGETQGIGIGLAYVDTSGAGFFEGIAQGWRTMTRMTASVTQGLGQLVSGRASVGDLVGPVGLTTVVAQASQQGLVEVLLLTAFISINLALLNLIPFPALDGGRILFVIIESIIRKRIPAKVGMWVNGIGFLLLMILMIVVTVKDVINLF